MTANEAFEKCVIALALGLLVGLQRERAQSRLAGIRTFALITLLGAVSGLLAQKFGGWIIAGGLVALAVLLFVGNLNKISAGTPDAGLTTEIAALLMYGVGAYLIAGHAAVAVALGGSVALLLHFKAAMHGFVAAIGEKDVTAIMQFVLITLVIYPVLPDESFGPYEALNPSDIWFMVVLIVGISLGGYVAYKLFGQQAGALLGGLLGGLISSTATTMSYARRAREEPGAAAAAGLVIVIASTVAYARVLVEVFVVSRTAFWLMAPPLLTMLGWMVGVSSVMFLLVQREKMEVPEPENPAELKPALFFGALYAVVVLGIAWASDALGNAGLYGVAFLSGLHDMDAITLSTTRYVEQALTDGSGGVAPATGWRLILLASLSNFLFKGGLAWALGGWPLVRWLALPFAAAFVAGAALLLLWYF